jgi:hypothetical protein
MPVAVAGGNTLIELLVLLVIICLLLRVFNETDMAFGGGLFGLLAAIIVVILVYKILLGNEVVAF